MFYATKWVLEIIDQLEMYYIFEGRKFEKIKILF